MDVNRCAALQGIGVLFLLAASTNLANSSDEADV